MEVMSPRQLQPYVAYFVTNIYANVVIIGVNKSIDLHGLKHTPLLWRHNGRDSVSSHQSHVYLLNRLFRRRSKKTSKLRVTGLCAGNSPGTGEFPAQMASVCVCVCIASYWPGRPVISGGFAAGPLHAFQISPKASLIV